MLTCHKCGGQNRPGARFCSSCGADISPTRQVLPAESERGGAPKPEASGISGVVRSLKRAVKGPKPPPPPPQATSRLGDSSAESPFATARLSTEEEPVSPQPSALPTTKPGGGLKASLPLTPLPVNSILTHPQDPARRYGIAKAWQLERSIYYDALDLNCTACQAIVPQMPLRGLCPQCQASLGVVLIHERVVSPGTEHTADEVEQLVQLSTGHHNIISHRDMLQYEEHVYTVVEHPGQWGVLVRGRRQRTPDEALAGAVQVAQALEYLHAHGFAHSVVSGSSIESLVVVGGGKDVRLTDLSPCVSLPRGDAEARQVQIDRDITFLGKLLFFLATNKQLSRSNIEFAPPSLQPFVERALQNQYQDVGQMLVDFSQMPSGPAAGRSLKASHGQATHPGQKHPRNEDAVVTFTFDKEQDGRTVPVGFYLVADGMGGHDAGDLASRTVNRIVTDRIIKIQVLPDLRKTTQRLSSIHVPAEILSEAIEKANEVIYERGQKKNSDLGSTVTAALVIGDVATIANVGDSRTYLLREKRLERITQDHSLVARLADAGVIKPEEIRTHPQRNQIYRCLGHKPKLDVDTFTVQLQAGDRLILCSDGLWEMVLDDDIQRIVEKARTPQKACDVLIEEANRAGGDDNISVIVVELE
jgi:serine/threonine protein phosphatase PrpC